MRNLFSSPRATRLLAVVMAICIGTVCFAVAFMWPDNTPNRPGIIGKLCVTVLFGSIYLWEAFRWWKAWLIEYRYGLRLLDMDQNSKTIDTTTDSNSCQTPAATLQWINQPAKEKLRFPWPSAICCSLLALLLFLVLDLIGPNEPVPGGLLVVWCGACIWVFLPFYRWSIMIGHHTMPFQAMKADDKTLLPLDRNLICLNDSNFFRFHERKLTELGYRPLGEQRYRHFFADPTGRTIAILGRNSITDTLAEDYFSLLSIDDLGCIIESSTLDRPYIEKWVACHEQWNFQYIDSVDVENALACHHEFVTATGIGRQHSFAESEYALLASYIHAITTNAKIRYYNQYRVAFA